MRIADRTVLLLLFVYYYYYNLCKCDYWYFVNLVIKPAKTVKLLIKHM